MLDLFKFYRMFPNYDDFKVPMWSKVREKAGEMIIEIVIPGFERENFELTFDDAGLNLKVTRNDEKENSVREYVILTSWYDRDYDFSKALAEYKSGILKIKVPKTDKKRKALPVKIS